MKISGAVSIKCNSPELKHTYQLFAYIISDVIHGGDESEAVWKMSQRRLLFGTDTHSTWTWTAFGVHNSTSGADNSHRFMFSVPWYKVPV